MSLKRYLQQITGEELSNAFAGLDAKTSERETEIVDAERTMREGLYPGITEFPTMLANAFKAQGLPDEHLIIIHIASDLTIQTLIEIAEVQELPPV